MIRIVVEGANLNMREMNIIKDITQLSLYDIRDRATNHTDMVVVDPTNEEEMKLAAQLIQQLQTGHVSIYAYEDDQLISLSTFDPYISTEEDKMLEDPVEEDTETTMIRVIVEKSDKAIMSIKIIKDHLGLNLKDIKDRLDYGEEMLVVDADEPAQMAIAARLVQALEEYRIPVIAYQGKHKVSTAIFDSYAHYEIEEQVHETPVIQRERLENKSYTNTDQRPWWKKLFGII